MYSTHTHRLDTPPPQSTFRRPWSPEPFDPYTYNGSIPHEHRNQGYGNIYSALASQSRREPSDPSVEALDLADYAGTLPSRSHNAFDNYNIDNPYPSVTDYRSSRFTLSTPPPAPASLLRADTLQSAAPSLVSAGPSSQSHASSSYPRTPSRRPFSLPALAPVPRNPHSLQNAQPYSPAPVHVDSQRLPPALDDTPAEVDIANFPRWSRKWYEGTKSPASTSVVSHVSPPPPQYNYNPNSMFSPQVHSSVAGSHRPLLPWSAQDGYNGSDITAEMKEERMRMLEGEFGPKAAAAYMNESEEPVGSVDAKGNIVNAGPKKRALTRWVQGTLAVGATIASFYSALLLKPTSSPPPRGKLPAYLLYGLSVITTLLLLYLFLFRPCCCAGKRSDKSHKFEGPGGALVLPVQNFPGGSGGKNKKKKKNKKGKGGTGGGGEGVQVNLIVDPTIFGGRMMGHDDDDDASDGDDDELGNGNGNGSSVSRAGRSRPRPTRRRRGIFEGLAIEESWKSARSFLKKLLFFDIAMMVLWGTVFVVILLGQRCPAGKFDGWCDGYNVASAIACFLVFVFGLSVFFDVKDLHASRVSPRTRT